MEPLFVIVGFLGAGKTTLMKKLVQDFQQEKYASAIILNDYLNAQLDAQQFVEQLKLDDVQAIGGRCICCDGLNELRLKINQMPVREKGITFVEANGTTDACALLEFLGVGLKERFQPPIQLGVVDVRHWQKREVHNELESSQVQASSIIVLNFVEDVDKERKKQVLQQIGRLNSQARLMEWKNLQWTEVLQSAAQTERPSPVDHSKSHWAACSVPLPDPMEPKKMNWILENLPKNLLRVKACTRLESDDFYTFFERVPDGKVHSRRFYGNLVNGAQLLTVGPGSDPQWIQHFVEGASHG